jgi:hypothetical protein
MSMSAVAVDAKLVDGTVEDHASHRARVGCRTNVYYSRRRHGLVPGAKSAAKDLQHTAYAAEHSVEVMDTISHGEVVSYRFDAVL